VRAVNYFRLKKQKEIRKDTMMSYSRVNNTRFFLNGREFRLTMALVLFLILQLVAVSPAEENDSVQHYKMISSVEYTGKGQFSNRTETLFTVKREEFSENEFQYIISGKDLNPSIVQQSLPTAFSFILDRNTRRFSGTGREMDFWAKVNNESVKSLQKVTKYNVGKTWKQIFNLAAIDKQLPGGLNFTLTAIELETEIFGRMVAVRAMSEPFFVQTGNGSIRSKINAVYVFDPKIEDVYLSISVFIGETNAYGFKETLRHEVATYKTDAVGTSVDLTGLGDKFEKFVQKVGLSRTEVKINQKTPLPRWARSEGLMAAQAANICVAMACEGALNPVVIICIPAVQMVGLQSMGRIPSIGRFATADTVAGTLGRSVPGLRTMNIAMAPGILGNSLGTAAIIGSGATGGVAIGGGFDSDDDNDIRRVASPF
jgi:hypothetical protein